MTLALTLMLHCFILLVIHTLLTSCTETMATKQISVSIEKILISNLLKRRNKYPLQIGCQQHFFHKAKRIFCRFCLLQNLLYLCLQTLKEFWVFPFRQSFEWGRVNANHNATRLPSLVHQKKTDNDSRLLKNSEGNRNGEWKFCRGTDADITLFLQVTKIRKISKIRKIFEAN